jgi:hypothetical protein
MEIENIIKECLIEDKNDNDTVESVIQMIDLEIDDLKLYNSKDFKVGLQNIIDNMIPPMI